MITKQSMLLSVDPMADKFYSTSPYMYCVGNPVKFIDPNGMDTIIFNNRGKMSEPIPAKGDHVFVKGSNKERRTQKLAYDQNGKLQERHKPYNVDRNSIKIHKGNFFSRNTSLYLNEKGVGSGEGLFNFFAENTRVEWSYNAFVKLDDLCSPNAILTTSHLDDQVNSTNEILNIIFNPDKFILISDIHSHPPDKDGTQYPEASKDDREYRRMVTKAGHYSTIFRFYSNGDFYDFNDKKD